MEQHEIDFPFESKISIDLHEVKTNLFEENLHNEQNIKVEKIECVESPINPIAKVNISEILCNENGMQQNEINALSTDIKIAKPFKCDLCLKEFNFKANWKTHMQRHNGILPFQCEVCSKRFINQSCLRKHEQIHTGIKEYKCNVCLKEFGQKAHLDIHMRIHLGIKPFKCQICSKRCRIKSDLTKHERIHIGAKPFKCEICLKKFSVSSHLNRHKQTHLGIKPFKCEKCSKGFLSKSDVVKHERIHTGIKPFQCETCLTSFNRKSSLVSHALIHSESKPFKCDQCLKDFRRKSSMIRHKLTHIAKPNIRKPLKLEEVPKYIQPLSQFEYIHVSNNSDTISNDSSSNQSVASLSNENQLAPEELLSTDPLLEGKIKIELNEMAIDKIKLEPMENESHEQNVKLKQTKSTL